MVRRTTFTALFFLNPLAALALPSSTSSNADSSLTVDVGYAKYQGYKDANSNFNIWEGIRYAAPPTGNQRWRVPQAPASNGGQVIQANSAPPFCPQTFAATGGSPGYGGNEDCLFLNVLAPQGASKLPVGVHIHGGGYGSGSATNNFTEFASINNYGAVMVSIQYRLSAFGFLASTAIHNDGTPNAGLYDQHFALQWIQTNIAKFGGDPSKVTLFGQSAGGGSVEMQALAFNGTDGTKNFVRGIASSPYTPVTYGYSQAVPEQRYLLLANQTGCYTGPLNSTGNSDPAILKCLRNVDSDTLQTANRNIGTQANYGSWLYVPVVDGTFIVQRPSQQLITTAINGQKFLSSSNSDDGGLGFVYDNINNQQDFQNWLLSEYPLLTSDDIQQINKNYPYRDIPGYYATCGDCGGPIDVNVGTQAQGHRQRAIDFFQEVTFACPSYWLASSGGKGGYRYEFAVPPAFHGLDNTATAMQGPGAFGSGGITTDFTAALTTSWGNMIKTGNPSITNRLANGNSTGNTASNVASKWPVYTPTGSSSGQFLVWNTTSDNAHSNAIRQANTNNWEGGQYTRCGFLATIGARIAL